MEATQPGFSFIDQVVVGLYLLVTLVIALSVGRKVHSLADFSTASGSFTLPAVTATMAASFIGGGFSLGITAKGYEVGLLFLPIFLAFSLKTVVEGRAIAPRLRRYRNAATVGDVMGFHYGRGARLLAGLLSFLFCAGIVGVVSRASGIMLEKLIGIPLVLGAAIATVIVVLYSTVGGMRSSVISDCLQFVILGVAIPLIPLSILFGWHDVPHGVTLTLPTFSSDTWGHMPTLAALGAAVGFFFGEMLVPPYTQRAFVAESSRTASRGYSLAALFSVPWIFLLLVVGIAARPAVPGADPDSVLLSALQMTLPIGLLGLCAAALLAIVMSTQDSFLNAAATSFVHDIYRPFINRDATDAAALRAGRLSTVVVGALGIVLALIIPGLIDALLYLYTIWAPTIILPFILAVVGVRAGGVSGILAMVAGAVVTAFWAWGLGDPFGVPALIPGMVANQIAFWASRDVKASGSRWSWLQPERLGQRTNVRLDRTQEEVSR